MTGQKRKYVGGGASACTTLVGMVGSNFMPEWVAGILTVLGVAGLLFFVIQWVWDEIGRPAGCAYRLGLIVASLGSFLLVLGVAKGVYTKVQADTQKPQKNIEEPDLAPSFVPDSDASGKRLLAHIAVTNLGNDEAIIVLKRYFTPDGRLMGSDDTPQRVLPHHPIRIDIPSSEHFLEEVVRPSGGFVLELTYKPANADQSMLRTRRYPFRYADDFASGPIDPIDSLPPDKTPARISFLDTVKHMREEKGTATVLLKEWDNGRENVACMPLPHDGGLLYWPSRHIVVYVLTQGKFRKSLSTQMRPNGSHVLVFRWDQLRSTMSLTVDGKPATRRKTLNATPGGWQPDCSIQSLTKSHGTGRAAQGREEGGPEGASV